MATPRCKRAWIVAAAGLAFIVFVGYSEVLNIDWDLGQRRRQETAFLEMRRLSVALNTFGSKKGGYPARLECLHDLSIETAIAEDEYHNRGFAESSWNHVIDNNHGGYIYDYQPSQPTKSDTVLFTHYALQADPVVRGKTGFRSFYVNDKGVIRWNNERRANGTDPVPDVAPGLDLHSYWRELLRR